MLPSHNLCSPGPKGCIYVPGSCDDYRTSHGGVGNAAIGKAPDPELPASGMLSRAERIVDERMSKYGKPTESWTRIGRMWGAYLNIDDIPAEVCLQMMTMVKKIRERYEHNPDNWEDDAGYVDCANRALMDKLKKEGGGTPPKREPLKNSEKPGALWPSSTESQ